MCRNIKTLANFVPPAAAEEAAAATRQFVRELSGTTKPSQANQKVFDRAVHEVAAAERLLQDLVTPAPPHDRDVEVVKARARSAKRFGQGLAPN